MRRASLERDQTSHTNGRGRNEHDASRCTHRRVERRRGRPRGSTRARRAARSGSRRRARALDIRPAQGHRRRGRGRGRARSAGTRVKGLWALDAAEARTTELAAGETVESFLTAKVPAPADHPRSYLERPVIVDGRVLCTIGLADAAPREWTERDLQMLENATAAVAVQIRLRLANHDAARFHELVASHNRVHELIAVGAPLREVLVELAEGIERHDPSVIPCVVLLDREASALRPGAAPSLPPHYFAAIDGVVIGPNVGTCGSAAWSGQLTITEDIAEDPKWAPIREFAVGAGLRHCWSMPIKSTTGEVLGTLALYGPRPRRPLAEHLTLIEDGARLAGIAIERHRALEQAHPRRPPRRAERPPKPHRDLRIARQAIVRIEPGSSVAVLFVDLDGLKTLNDTLGHDRADEMIREVGSRLSNAVRSTDFVGRFGGDEFIVVAEEIADRGRGVKARVPAARCDLAAAAGGREDRRDRQHRDRDHGRRWRRRARGDPPGRQRDVRGQARRRRPHGVLQREPAHARGSPPRRSRASSATPRRAASSGSCSSRCSSSRRTRSPASRRCCAGTAPRSARCRRPSSSRWPRTPGRSCRSGRWVLRESCETVRRIAEQAGRPVELSVNVSARQLAHPGFARSVGLILSHAEFPAAQLTLELTEAALVRADAVTAAHAARARVRRHPDRARRLRHRRVIAVVAEGSPGQRDQDRPRASSAASPTTSAIRRSCPR